MNDKITELDKLLQDIDINTNQDKKNEFDTLEDKSIITDDEISQEYENILGDARKQSEITDLDRLLTLNTQDLISTKEAMINAGLDKYIGSDGLLYELDDDNNLKVSLSPDTQYATTKEGELSFLKTTVENHLNYIKDLYKNKKITDDEYQTELVKIQSVLNSNDEKILKNYLKEYAGLDIDNNTAKAILFKKHFIQDQYLREKFKEPEYDGYFSEFIDAVQSGFISGLDNLVIGAIKTVRTIFNGEKKTDIETLEEDIDLLKNTKVEALNTITEYLKFYSQFADKAYGYNRTLSDIGAKYLDLAGKAFADKDASWLEKIGLGVWYGIRSMFYQTHNIGESIGSFTPELASALFLNKAKTAVTLGTALFQGIGRYFTEDTINQTEEVLKNRDIIKDMAISGVNEVIQYFATDLLLLGSKGTSVAILGGLNKQTGKITSMTIGKLGSSKFGDTFVFNISKKIVNKVLTIVGSNSVRKGLKAISGVTIEPTIEAVTESIDTITHLALQKYTNSDYNGGFTSFLKDHLYDIGSAFAGGFGAGLLMSKPKVIMESLGYLQERNEIKKDPIEYTINNDMFYKKNVNDKLSQVVSETLSKINTKEPSEALQDINDAFESLDINKDTIRNTKTLVGSLIIKNIEHFKDEITQIFGKPYEELTEDEKEKFKNLKTIELLFKTLDTKISPIEDISKKTIFRVSFAKKIIKEYPILKEEISDFIFNNFIDDIKQTLDKVDLSSILDELEKTTKGSEKDTHSINIISKIENIQKQFMFFIKNKDIFKDVLDEENINFLENTLEQVNSLLNKAKTINYSDLSDKTKQELENIITTLSEIKNYIDVNKDIYTRGFKDINFGYKLSLKDYENLNKNINKELDSLKDKDTIDDKTKESLNKQSKTLLNNIVKFIHSRLSKDKINLLHSNLVNGNTELTKLLTEENIKIFKTFIETYNTLLKVKKYVDIDLSELEDIKNTLLHKTNILTKEPTGELRLNKNIKTEHFIYDKNKNKIDFNKLKLEYIISKSIGFYSKEVKSKNGKNYINNKFVDKNGNFYSVNEKREIKKISNIKDILKKESDNKAYDLFDLINFFVKNEKPELNTKTEFLVKIKTQNKDYYLKIYRQLDGKLKFELSDKFIYDGEPDDNKIEIDLTKEPISEHPIVFFFKYKDEIKNPIIIGKFFENANVKNIVNNTINSFKWFFSKDISDKDIIENVIMHHYDEKNNTFYVTLKQDNNYITYSIEYDINDNIKNISFIPYGNNLKQTHITKTKYGYQIVIPYSYYSKKDKKIVTKKKYIQMYQTNEKNIGLVKSNLNKIKTLKDDLIKAKNIVNERFSHIKILDAISYETYSTDYSKPDKNFFKETITRTNKRVSEKLNTTIDGEEKTELTIKDYETNEEKTEVIGVLKFKTPNTEFVKHNIPSINAFFNIDNIAKLKTIFSTKTIEEIKTNISLYKDLFDKLSISTDYVLSKKANTKTIFDVIFQKIDKIFNTEYYRPTILQKEKIQVLVMNAIFDTLNYKIQNTDDVARLIDNGKSAKDSKIENLDEITSIFRANGYFFNGVSEQYGMNFLLSLGLQIDKKLITKSYYQTLLRELGQSIIEFGVYNGYLEKSIVDVPIKINGKTTIKKYTLIKPTSTTESIINSYNELEKSNIRTALYMINDIFGFNTREKEFVVTNEELTEDEAIVRNNIDSVFGSVENKEIIKSAVKMANIEYVPTSLAKDYYNIINAFFNEFSTLDISKVEPTSESKEVYEQYKSLLEFLGYKEIKNNLSSNEKLQIQGINETIYQDIQNFFNFYNKVKDIDFNEYGIKFKVQITSTNRIMYVSNFNPQASKIHRFLVKQKSNSDSELNLKNKEHSLLYKSVLLFISGYSVDKKNVLSLIQNEKELNLSYKLLLALSTFTKTDLRNLIKAKKNKQISKLFNDDEIKIISKILKLNKSNKIEINFKELFNNKQHFEYEIHNNFLLALTYLVNRINSIPKQNKKINVSEIMVEIDGITNGMFIKEFILNQVNSFNSGNIYASNNEFTTYANIKEKGTKDLYEKVLDKTIKLLEEKTKEFVEKFKDNENKFLLINMFNNILKVSSRSFVKKQSQEVSYGEKQSSLTQAVTKKIINEFAQDYLNKVNKKLKDIVYLTHEPFKKQLTFSEDFNLSSTDEKKQKLLNETNKLLKKIISSHILTTNESYMAFSLLLEPFGDSNTFLKIEINGVGSIKKYLKHYLKLEELYNLTTDTKEKAKLLTIKNQYQWAIDIAEKYRDYLINNKIMDNETKEQLKQDFINGIYENLSTKDIILDSPKLIEKIINFYGGKEVGSVYFDSIANNVFATNSLLESLIQSIVNNLIEIFDKNLNSKIKELYPNKTFEELTDDELKIIGQELNKEDKYLAIKINKFAKIVPFKLSSKPTTKVLQFIGNDTTINTTVVNPEIENAITLLQVAIGMGNEATTMAKTIQSDIGDKFLNIFDACVTNPKVMSSVAKEWNKNFTNIILNHDLIDEFIKIAKNNKLYSDTSFKNTQSFIQDFCNFFKKNEDGEYELAIDKEKINTIISNPEDFKKIKQQFNIFNKTYKLYSSMFGIQIITSSQKEKLPKQDFTEKDLLKFVENEYLNINQLTIPSIYEQNILKKSQYSISMNEYVNSLINKYNNFVMENNISLKGRNLLINNIPKDSNSDTRVSIIKEIQDNLKAIGEAYYKIDDNTHKTLEEKIDATEQIINNFYTSIIVANKQINKANNNLIKNNKQLFNTINQKTYNFPTKTIKFIKTNLNNIEKAINNVKPLKFLSIENQQKILLIIDEALNKNINLKTLNYLNTNLSKLEQKYKNNNIIKKIKSNIIFISNKQNTINKILNIKEKTFINNIKTYNTDYAKEINIINHSIEKNNQKLNKIISEKDLNNPIKEDYIIHIPSNISINDILLYEIKDRIKKHFKEKIKDLLNIKNEKISFDELNNIFKDKTYNIVIPFDFKTPKQKYEFIKFKNEQLSEPQIIVTNINGKQIKIKITFNEKINYNENYDQTITAKIEIIKNNKKELPTSSKETTKTDIKKTDSEKIIHSGGAVGSDSYFGEIASKYGFKVNHYYYNKDGYFKPPKANTHIKEEDINEGIEKVTKVAHQLGRMDKKYKVKNPLLIRNWSQVKYADEIYAIGHIVNKGEKLDKDRVAKIPQVKGGTGYAVQMAINEGKPVYVFDQERNAWFTYDKEKNSFVKLKEPPTPKTTNFAGIGTRNLKENGKKAINELFERLNSKIKSTTKGSEDTNIIGELEDSLTLDKNNFKSLLNSLRETDLTFTNKRILNNETLNFLNKIVDDFFSIHKIININIFNTNIASQAVGSIDLKNMTINLKRGTELISQTNIETIMHELIHANIRLSYSLEPRLKSQVTNIKNFVKKQLEQTARKRKINFSTLLAEIFTPETMNEEYAIRIYEYIMNDTTGEEFLAYALTHQNFREFLSNIPYVKSKIKLSIKIDDEDSTVIRIIKEIINFGLEKISNIFNVLSNTKQKKVLEHLLSIYDNLVKINRQLEIDKNLMTKKDKIIENLNKQLGSINEKIISTITQNEITKNTIKSISNALYKNAILKNNEIAKFLIETYNLIRIDRETSKYKEFYKKFYESKKILEVNKLEIEQAVKDKIKNLTKNMSKEDRLLLTDIFIKSDAVGSYEDYDSFMNDIKNINQKIEEYEEIINNYFDFISKEIKLKSLKEFSNKLIDDLSNYLLTNQTNNKYLQINAFNILNLGWKNKIDFKDKEIKNKLKSENILRLIKEFERENNVDLTSILDKLITLKTIKKIGITKVRKTLKNNNRNVLTEIFYSGRTAKQIEKNFYIKNNEISKYKKGLSFIEVKNNYEFHLVTKKDYEKLKKIGFKKIKDISKDAVLITNYRSLNSYTKGALETTNIEYIERYGFYLHNEIDTNKISLNEKKAQKNNDLSYLLNQQDDFKDTIFTSKNTMSAFLTFEEMEKLYDTDFDIANVIGYNIASAFKINRRTNINNELSKIVLEHFINIDDFNKIVLLSNINKNEEYRKLYNLIPQDTKKYIKQYLIDNLERIKANPNIPKFVIENIEKKSIDFIPVHLDLLNDYLGYEITSFLYTKLLSKLTNKKQLKIENITIDSIHIPKNDNLALFYKAFQTLEELITTFVYLAKPMLVIVNGKVVISNIISNFVTLSLKTGKPFWVLKKMLEYSKYYADLRKIEESEFNDFINTRNKNIYEEPDKIKENPLYDLYKAGYISSIIEDIDTNNEYNKIPMAKKLFKLLKENTNKNVFDLFSNVYSTPSSLTFKTMTELTLYGDVISKGILYEYLRKYKGMNKEDALILANETFISYNILLPKGLEYANKYGLALFMRFFLNNIRVVFNIITKNPLNLGLYELGVDNYINPPDNIETYNIEHIDSRFNLIGKLIEEAFDINHIDDMLGVE